MLSASYGQMPMMQGGYDFGPHGGPSYYSSSTMMPPPPREHTVSGGAMDAFGGPHMGYAGPTGSFGPPHSVGMYGQPMIIGPSPQMRAPRQVQPQVSTSTWNQFTASPPPSQMTVIIVRRVSVKPVAPVASSLPDVSSIGNPNASLPVANSLPKLQSPIQAALSPVPRIAALTRPPAAIIGDVPAVSILPSLVQTTVPSAIAAISPTALAAAIAPTAQTLSSSNTVEKASVVTARDVAFQVYNPNSLLVATTAVAPSRVDQVSVAEERALRGNSSNGPLRPAAFSSLEDNSISTEIVRREREAVERILRDLQDTGRLRAETAEAITTNVTDENNSGIENQDMATGGQIGISLAIDSEGGMIMLQAVDDANGSQYDLTSTVDDGWESVQAFVGMEPAVGMYQAIDIATEDIPAQNSSHWSAPQSEPGSVDASMEHLPTENGSPTSRKTAAAIGMTSLVGGMLWMNLGARRDSATEKKAPKKKLFLRV
jgi:hypothetical protein